MHVLRLQLAHQLFINLGFECLKLAGALQNCLHLLLAGHIGLIISNFFSRVHLIHQGTDAHHKKFVQVRLINRHKRQSFCQRHMLVFRFAQHANIEL